MCKGDVPGGLCTSNTERNAHTIVYDGTNVIPTKKDPDQSPKILLIYPSNSKGTVWHLNVRHHSKKRLITEDSSRCKSEIKRNHCTTKTRRNLNALKLHLNKRSTQVLSNEFAEAISY